MTTPPTELRDLVNREVVPRVDRFRGFQDPSGRVVRESAAAADLLRELAAPVRRVCDELRMTAFADAFADDVERWLRKGLASPPAFDRCEAAFVPPDDNADTFFVAPFTATNGPAPQGKFLECFLARREEPEECRRVAQLYPHPKNLCQSLRLWTGSYGIVKGNCIVFFPENIATEEPVDEQTYAMFFFNKFQRFYLEQTMPRVHRLLGKRDVLFDRSRWISAEMDSQSCYRARCIWGYLHDRYHHCGPRPFDQNIQLKIEWFAGLLEEIKVDCQSAIATLAGEMPYGPEIFEFILFERMFRYPGQPDATSNFDAGTGVFLFEWLYRHGAITAGSDGGLTIDKDDCLAGMQSLIDTVEELDRAPIDDEEYGRRARRIVRQLLPEGKGEERFSLPETYATKARIVADGELLDFQQLPY